MLPAIFGLSGLVLTDAERGLFRACQPLGFILFGRNINSPDQVRRLTDDLRSLTGRANLPVLIDQEGGRVARLAPPGWAGYPSAARFGELYRTDPETARRACRLNYEALGLELAILGITVNCAPVLDVLQPGAHDIIGDRAFAADPAAVAALGREALDGLASAGVVGVIKHVPGHGRAKADSHEALPTVADSDDSLSRDLAPFQALADAPMAMTAHICYPAWDETCCATLSPTIIQQVIRTRIGFDGLLMSDDLDMKALQGSVPELALEAVNAGCDVALNCWGRIADMEGIAERLPTATAPCLSRLDRAMGMRDEPDDSAQLGERLTTALQERDTLLANPGA